MYSFLSFPGSSSHIPNAMTSDPPAITDVVASKPAAAPTLSVTAETSSSGRTQSLPETSTIPTLGLRNPLPPPLTPPPPPPPAPDTPDLPLPSPPVFPLPLPSSKPSSTSSPPPSPLLADSPQRPTTLNLKTLPRPSVRENGCPPPGLDEDEDERKMLEEDLKKCIEDFKRIRMPNVFPDRKRHWQRDLLKKYNA